MVYKNFGKKSFLANLWLTAIILFVFRSLFEPLVYPAALSIVLLFVYSSVVLLKNWERKIISNFFNIAKENIILMIFIVVALFLSENTILHPIKELINFVIVLFLLFIYSIIRNKLLIEQFNKYFIYSSIFIGVLALFTWLNFILSLDLKFFNYIESYKTVESFISLSSDYNFYSLLFLFSLISYFFYLHKGESKVNILSSQLILWIFVLNVLFSGSRRSLIFLGLLFFLAIFVSIKQYKESFNNLLYKNILLLLSIVLSLIIVIMLLMPFRSKIITDPTIKYNTSFNIYRLVTVFDNRVSFNEIHLFLWNSSNIYAKDRTNWSSYKALHSVESLSEKYDNIFDLQDAVYRYDKTNLIWNGNFINNLACWSINTSKNDSVTHEIIATKFGNAIRVNRKNGVGNWPLKYNGRPIKYYKGVTYTFKFKFRVVKGKGIPFNIGWWLKDDGHLRYSLKKNVTDLNNGWKQCECSYTFKETHIGNYATFMNSQRKNTIIDFADISLSVDNDSLQYFVKQDTYANKVNLIYNGDFAHESKYWGCYFPNIALHKLISTDSVKYIQVNQKEGKSYWPFYYRGRDMYLYRNKEYVFRFMYRIIQGSKSSFNVGYTFIDSNKHVYSISKVSYKLQNNWHLCTVSFTPKEDHFVNKPIFISNQLPNTVVQYANIELLCDSSLLDSSYIDQNLDKYRVYEMQKLEVYSKNDTIDKLIAPRLDRWKYAIEIYKSYSITEKIFGKGFDYMAQFNQKFYNPDMSLDEIREKQMYDYPHSPILSSFLFSGIIGGLFYLYFTALTFWYYFKNRKELQVFFIMWLIGYSFIMVSDNTHFSAPIFVILSLVPYVWERLPGMKNSTPNPTEKEEI